MNKDSRYYKYSSYTSKQYRKYRSEWDVSKQVRVRLAVIHGYGGKCNCCGESNLVFLEIDHMNNDAMRRVLKGEPRKGPKLYRWLIKNEFPDGFQVLCRNCNWGKWRCGTCPHQRG